jgi:hypothetical protein
MILTDNIIDVPYFLCALTVFCFSSMVILAVYERFNSELSGIEGDFSE